MSVLRTNREIRSHQIQDCLATVNVLRGCLHGLDADTGQNTARTDGGIASAVEHSLNIVLSRLDTIFTDDASWKVPEVDAHLQFYGMLDTQRKISLHQLTALDLQMSMARQKLVEAAALEKSLEALSQTQPSRRRKKK